MSLPRKVQRLNAFAAGILIGLCAITPAFAATSFSMESLATRDVILGVSLILLVVALAVRLMRSRRAPGDRVEEESDLRWWRNSDPMTGM